MKIAVTGASGFIGRALCGYLAQNGHSIVKLPHIIFEDDSIEDFETLLDGTDIFINLAGESTIGRWTDKKKEDIYNSRIDVTRKLVNTINSMKNKPRMLISTSAVGYYKQDMIVDEDSKPDGERFLSKVCIDWEKEAEKVSDEVKLVILRFGVVMGKDGGFMPNIMKILKNGIKIDFGSGKQKVSWIHIDDLVRIYELIIEENNEIPKIINCVSPDIVTMENIIDQLSEYIHPIIPIKIPSAILHTFLKEGETLLTGSYEVNSIMLPRIGYIFIYDNFVKAAKELTEKS